jgi:DedD protein
VKERLTGAIILVALIVLLVPELLTGPVRSAPRASSAGAAEEAPLRSYTINLADDAHAHAAGTVSGPQQPVPLSAVAAIAPQAQDGTVQASAPPATEAPPPPSAEPSAKSPPARSASPKAPKSAKSAAKASARAHAGDEAGSGDAGAWMVQLGSFASRDNAERLAQQVRAGGFRVNVQQASSGRHLYRVLVGPAHDRAAAGQLAAKLQAAGHGGAVVPH